MLQPDVTTDETVVCHECESEFQRPGYHWSNGQCDYPDIPRDKQAIVTGLMLGDATLRTHTSRPFVQIYMINRPFLEWVDEQLEWLSTGVSLYRTAERSAELSQQNGHPNASVENYHDVYVLQSRTMPQFDRYTGWYEQNGTDDRVKHFPSYVVLTPEIARLWYACDGSLNWDRRYPNARPYATIGVTSEMDEIDNVIRMFEESTFGYTPRIDEHTIRFSVEETQALLQWMGDAPPGFEYKWELSSLDQYEQLKADALGDATEDT